MKPSDKFSVAFFAVTIPAAIGAFFIFGFSKDTSVGSNPVGLAPVSLESVISPSPVPSTSPSPLPTTTPPPLLYPLPAYGVGAISIPLLPVAENPAEGVLQNSSPKVIKAIYLTRASAGSPRTINYLIDLAKNGLVNATVIDIKDSSGYLAYNTDAPLAKEYGAESDLIIYNIDNFIDKLHGSGIYVIARIVVFQDQILARARPDLAVQKNPSVELSSAGVGALPVLWQDYRGLAWVDPAAKEAWNYNINIARDAISRGFDEINFDYIRFPSDGDMKNIVFPFWDGITQRRLILKNFYQYVREQMPDAKLSADLFGYSTTNFDDLGVGQIIEDAFEYFDFVSPMVYPSHYAPGFLEFDNPNEHPYEVVGVSLKSALGRLQGFLTKNNFSRTVALRPWLQDFSLKGVFYDAKKVRSEIQAAEDALGDDFSGFMLWNAGNIYTIAALQPQDQTAVSGQ